MATMVRFVTHSTPAGHHYDAVDRLASRFARKRRSQRARAGLSSMPHRGCGAALGLRACCSGAHHELHERLRRRAKSLTPAGAATERGGPADRRTPERPTPVDALCDRSGPRSTLSTKTHTHNSKGIPRAPPVPPLRVPADLVARAHADPLGDGPVLGHLLRERPLRAEGLVRRLRGGEA